MAMPTSVVRLAAVSADGEVSFVPEGKRLLGNPRQTVWLHYEDPAGKFFVGEWHSEVGRWKVAYTEMEYCHMLEGTSVLTDEAGQCQTFHAGDSFVVPRGFAGTWEVLVPTRKRFVIYEPGDGPA